MNILLVGYYGYGNVGDECVLRKSIQYLRDTLDNPTIKVAHKYGGDSVDECQTIQRTSPLAALHSIAWCDKLVFGGGGLLQNKTSQQSLLNYLSILWIAQMMGKETELLAQGIGPIKGKFSRWVTSRVLKKCTQISVRDAHSQTLCHEMSIKNTKLFSDMAFYKSPRLSHDRGDYVGVSIRDWPHFSKEENKAIQTQLDPIKDKTIFLDFNPPHDWQAYLAHVPNPSEFTRNNRWDMTPYLATEIPLPKSLKEVIAMRYHAGIFAILRDIPFSVIAYDPKVEGLVK